MDRGGRSGAGADLADRLLTYSVTRGDGARQQAQEASRVVWCREDQVGMRGYLTADIGAADDGDGEPIDTVVLAGGSQSIEGKNVVAVVAEHEYRVGLVLADEPPESHALGGGAGRPHLPRPDPTGLIQQAAAVDGIDRGADLCAGRNDIGGTTKVEGQRRALVLQHQPGLRHQPRHLQLEALGHGSCIRGGRLPLHAQRLRPEAARCDRPLSTVVTEIADAAHAGTRGEITGGPATDERDMDAWGRGQPPQRALGSGDDAGLPGVERQPREGAVEIARDQQPPAKQGSRTLEGCLRRRQGGLVRSQ